MVEGSVYTGTSSLNPTIIQTMSTEEIRSITARLDTLGASVAEHARVQTERMDSQDKILCELDNTTKEVSTQVAKLSKKIDGVPGDVHNPGVFGWMESQRESSRHKAAWRDWFIKMLIASIVGAAAIAIFEWRLDAHVQQTNQQSTQQPSK
jgi:hypothetical protein